MPQMPEIIGEAQNSGPELVENETVEEKELNLKNERPTKDHFNNTGIHTYESPLQLRLFDFSSEGERAPPVE